MQLNGAHKFLSEVWLGEDMMLAHAQSHTCEHIHIYASIM